jgi:arylsulfatase A
MPIPDRRHSLLAMRVALLGALALLCVTSANGAGAERPPNIVVIFTDDQAYGDVGVYGAKGIRTPNLDRMAAQGIRFTDFYVAQPVCSSSRVALLTGCYPNRLGIVGALGPRDRHGIHDDESTLAEVCKSRGYATAIFGKWHLGHHPQFLPTRHGFEMSRRSFSSPATTDRGSFTAITPARQALCARGRDRRSTAASGFRALPVGRDESRPAPSAANRR